EVEEQLDERDLGALGLAALAQQAAIAARHACCTALAPLRSGLAASALLRRRGALSSVNFAAGLQAPPGPRLWALDACRRPVGPGEMRWGLAAEAGAEHCGGEPGRGGTP